MLSYVTLLAGSLVVLLAVSLICKIIYFAFQSVSDSVTPASGTCEPVTFRNSSAEPPKKSKISSAVHDSLTPQNRRNHETAENRTKTQPVDSDSHDNQKFDWLLCERTSAASYTVRRRFTPTPLTLEMVSKPFSQERAQWVLEHEASKKS